MGSFRAARACCSAGAFALVLGACGGTKNEQAGAGGSDGSSGSGSAAESAGGAGAGGPSTNVYVDSLRQTVVDKLDLLLMLDNSISMADKQALLADALPRLVQRLVTPQCVRACTASDSCTAEQLETGILLGANADASGSCADGEPEFRPIADIHVGLITSSLGAHGAAGQADVCVSPEDDDHAQLLGVLRTGLPSWNNSGFLAWDPRALHTPPGHADANAFAQALTATVQAAGERGCGYEASLEAWYRFLIEPEPPLAVLLDSSTQRAAPVGIDASLLAQRAAFLRPDSLVAIVMLTDEDDCSIVDEGYGWLLTRASPMLRATSQCQTNPNDPCCRSCAEVADVSGCPATASDAECAKGATLEASGEDDLNLRCWEQKRRFGVELLYPTQRYSNALRSTTVQLRSTGASVANPLFAPSAGAPVRDPGLVYLAGIIGVPWQDIADDASLSGPGLRYQTASELAASGRWDVVLGDPNATPPVLPSDPFMVATPRDRTTIAGLPQANPIVNAELAPATSTSPQANVINGHEQDNQGNRDLQFACTFPLLEPRVCDDAALEANLGCDCFPEALGVSSPLCQPPGGGPQGNTQYYAKAYPGLRQLQVLKDFGDNAIVASICPKVLDTSAPDYGYYPALKALVARLKGGLAPRCLPRPLLPDSSGQVACVIVEATQDGEPCDCEARGRVAIDDRPALVTAIGSKMREQQDCGTLAGLTDCNAFCTCELPQLSGDELSACQNSPTPPAAPGFCYISAAPGEPNLGNPELLRDCRASEKHLLRFVGGAPAEGALTYIACL